MTYFAGLTVLIALLAVVLVHRRIGLGHPARHRADVEVPGLWTAWRQRSDSAAR